MRIVVVSLVVLLAYTACVSAQAGAPDIRRISILDLLNENPELKASLSAGIEAERRKSKSSPPSPGATQQVAKPKRPSLLRPVATTTSSPVPQADTPAAAPQPTTPQTNAPGRRQRPTTSEHRFSGGLRPRRPRPSEAAPETEGQRQQNGRQRPGIRNQEQQNETNIQPSTAAPEAAAVQETQEQGQGQQNVRRRRPGARRRRPRTTTENPEPAPAPVESNPTERPTRRRTNGRTFPGRSRS